MPSIELAPPKPLLLCAPARPPFATRYRAPRRLSPPLWRCDSISASTVALDLPIQIQPTPSSARVPFGDQFSPVPSTKQPHYASRTTTDFRRVNIRAVLSRSQLFAQVRAILDMPASGIRSPLADLDATAAPSDSSTAPSRRPRRPHICPEPGSLYDIMHTYSGHGLYVLPICWTDLHIKSLNVQFKQQAPMIFPAPEPHRYPSMPPPPPPEPSATAKQLCAELSTFVQGEASPVEKLRALKHLISGFFPDMPCKTKTSVDLDLHFGTKFYRRSIKLPVIWKRADSRCDSFDSAATRPMSSSSQESSSSDSGLGGSRGGSSSSRNRFDRNAPLLAYIDRDHLAVVRKTLFRVSPGPKHGDYANTPVTNLQRLRSKALVPGNPDCDAHFIAVMIAMAQARFYSKSTGRRKFRLSQSSQGSTGTPDSSLPCQPDAVIHDVEVRLFTFDAAAKDFIVYSGSIGADFLEGFAEPSQRLHRGPEGSSSMHVSYTKVPAWPFYGLKERLGKALGSDITGIKLFAPGYDTFHTPEELPLYEAEVERIRQDEERRYGKYQAFWREEQHHRLRQLLSKSFDEDSKKRSRESSRGGDRSPSSSPAKRRRGTGVAEVEVC